MRSTDWPEFVRALDAALAALPELPPLEEPEIREIHRRLVALKVDSHNQWVKRARRVERESRRSRG